MDNATRPNVAITCVQSKNDPQPLMSNLCTTATPSNNLLPVPVRIPRHVVPPEVAQLGDQPVILAVFAHKLFHRPVRSAMELGRNAQIIDDAVFDQQELVFFSSG